VASGLTGDAVYVRPTRLALHFTFALGLISYAFWFALQLLIPPSQKITAPAIKKWTWFLVTLLLFQLVYGALMAGHKAATISPTWPDMNGMLVPDGMFSEGSLFLNMIENKITVHFVHRILAYLLLTVTIIFTVKMLRIPRVSATFKRVRRAPLVLVITQVLLGILTVLTSIDIVPNQWGIFEWIAQLHQIVAVLFLLSLISILYLTSGKSFMQPL
jgi:cytochrome c oxidase assembly protein subunit 15